MNKTELVNAVAEAAGLTKKDADAAVKAVVESIEKAVAAGETVSVPGFGTFAPKTLKARTGRNPRTGEEIAIAESKSVAFKAGAAFKKAVK